MTNVEALCADWLAAKSAETKAQKQRIAIEAQLAQALDVPAEGSKTHNLENYKVVLTQPVSRKLDAKAWEKLKGKIPTNLHPVNIKVEADPTGCKYLLKEMPQSWAQIAPAFETKPGKIGVKVEAV